MAILPVLDKEGLEKDSINLPDEMFPGKVNNELLHQVVLMYLANHRQGTAATKTRGEVSGGGVKPFRQKGTGRARAGSIRSPLWRGGGTVFGPHPRDFGYSLPKSMKKAALRESLHAKLISKEIYCIQDLKEILAKTKEFSQILKNIKLNGQGKILALLDGSHESIFRVSRNLAYFDILRAQDVNAYNLLCYKKILLTQQAMNILLKRIL